MCVGKVTQVSFSGQLNLSMTLWPTPTPLCVYRQTDTDYLSRARATKKKRKIFTLPIPPSGGREGGLWSILFCSKFDANHHAVKIKLKLKNNDSHKVCVKIIVFTVWWPASNNEWKFASLNDYLHQILSSKTMWPQDPPTPWAGTHIDLHTEQHHTDCTSLRLGGRPSTWKVNVMNSWAGRTHTNA